jgi:hypothetical protein
MILSSPDLAQHPEEIPAQHYLNILLTEPAFRQLRSETDRFQLPSRKGRLKKEFFLIYSNLPFIQPKD